jgi:long-chain acyl-CoA synthetase
VTSSLAEILRHHVSQQPLAPFLTDAATGTSLTYAAGWQRSTGFAGALQAAGVRPGDRVALVLENSWHWAAAFLGSAIAGAIVVPFNTRWSVAEIRHALADCEPALVVCDDGSIATAGPLAPGRMLHAAEFPDGGPEDASLPPPESIAAITYTSGTSGAARGVMLTHRALLQASLTYAGLFNSAPLLRTAVTVPLFHNTGFIDGLGHAIVAGGHVDLYRRFDAALLARKLRAGDYSYLIGVPTMYARMLAHLGDGQAGRANGPWLAYGGAAMPAATVRRLRELLPAARLVNCYGMSEATSITHYLPHDLCDRALDAVGIPVPGTLDRISDSGELEVKSPTVMTGYWNDPAGTAAKLADGWLRTGDCARRSPDGLVTITGRIGDLINRGGEKVAPYEVESALCELPGILEAVVIGVPHHDLGEVPAALVVCAAGTSVSEQGIRDGLSSRLADYKIPQRVLTVPDLPKNANGKVRRPEALRLFLRQC